MILPNQLTVLRIILTPVFLYLFLSGNPVLVRISFVVFIIAAITDWYDGWLARKFNYITNWGKFMDPLADKILTSAAFFGFVFWGVLPMWMVIVIVVRDFTITLLRVFADLKKVKFTTSRVAKIKTFAQMFFLYYLLFFYMLESFDYLRENYQSFFEILLNPYFVYWAMFAITIFTAYTGISYFISNGKLIKKLFISETEIKSN